MSSASTTASSNFQAIFNSALVEYTKQTGKDLRNHPLASEIDSCDSADSIANIFKEQAKKFDEFRKGDSTKLVKWLEPVVKVLHFFFFFESEFLSRARTTRHRSGHVQKMLRSMFRNVIFWKR